MFDFIKYILRKDTTRLAGIDPDPGLFGFKVGLSALPYYNNNCESTWAINMLIPVGYTATVTGILVGYEGGGTVQRPVLSAGTFQIGEGLSEYDINLGNSNQAGVMSSMTVIVEINETGQQKIVLAQRGPTQSAFYDKEPC